MTATKETIIEALNTFDHRDDKIWTEDGAPLVGVVQKRANDASITRAQINDALPGFQRKTTDAVEEPQEDDGTDPGAADIHVTDTAPLTAVDGPVNETPLAEVDEHLPSTEELRAIIMRQISDAEQALQNARKDVSDARQVELMAERRLGRVMLTYQRKFPPISAAENIQRHLASQQAQKIARVEAFGNMGKSALDLRMEGRRRVQVRPTNGLPVARNAVL